MRAAFVAAAALAASAILQGTGASPAAAATDVTVLIPPNQFPGAVFEYGISKGIFAKNGLNVTYTIVPPPELIPQLAAGRGQFSYSPTLSGLKARTNAGIDVKLVSPLDGMSVNDVARAKKDAAFAYIADPTGVCTRPDSGITRAKQLEGRSVAVTQRGDSGELSMRSLMRADGGNPDTVKWVVLGMPGTVAAIKNGQVDAGYVGPPYKGQCVAEGLKIFGTPAMSLLDTGGPLGVVWTTGPYAAANPAVVKAMQKSLKEISLASRNKAQMREMVIASTKVTKLPAELALAVRMPFFFDTITKSYLEGWSNKLIKEGQITKPVDVAGILLPQPR